MARGVEAVLAQCGVTHATVQAFSRVRARLLTLTLTLTLSLSRTLTLALALALIVQVFTAEPPPAALAPCGPAAPWTSGSSITLAVDEW